MNAAKINSRVIREVRQQRADVMIKITANPGQFIKGCGEKEKKK